MKPKLTTHLPSHAWIAMRQFTKELDTPRVPEVHDHASIALFLGGEVNFWMQGSYRLGAGNVLLVPAGALHYLISARGSKSIGVSVCMNCMPEDAPEALTELLDAIRHGGCASRALSRTECDKLEGLFTELSIELDARHRAGRELAINALVSLITVTIMRANENLPEAAISTTNPLVMRAMDYIRQHALSGISLSDVAAHVSRSPAHVASIVKESTGETVVGWISRARMSECRQLLRHTDETIELIAERCGFASTSHFHRAFKRAHDMTPGEWRQANR